MKGFICYSKESNPKDIKKEDPLKCIKKEQHKKEKKVMTRSAHLDNI